VTVGLTRHAVDALTDVTFVELKPAGTSVRAGDSVAEVESVNTTSDVYSAVDGQVVDVNDTHENNPGLLNDDPYEHWLVRVKATSTAGLEDCVDAATYDREFAG
jgi:glycine cleavage system H protein